MDKPELTLNTVSPREHRYMLIIALVAAAVPLVIYSLRELDNNRLVGWAMISDLVRPSLPLAAILFGLPFAYALARFRLPNPVLLFAVAFLASALFWSVPEVIVDSSRYFTQAKHLAVYGPGFFFSHWGGEIDPWTDLPAMSFVYGIIFKYLGEVRLYAQVLNSLLFATTATVTLQLGRELWDRKTGDAAGVLLLAVPYLFSQTPLLMVDIGSMAFLTLAVYLFLLALRRGGAPLIFAAALAIFMAFFAKYSLWPMLSVLGLVFLLVLSQSPAAALKRGGAVGLLFALFAGPVLFYHFEVFQGQLILLREFQGPGLQKWQESFTSIFFFQTHPFVTLGAVFSVFLAAFRRDPKYLVAVWLLLLFVPIMQVGRIRYLVPLFPMLALMAAYGISAIGRERPRRFIVYCAVTASMAVALTAYKPYLQAHSLANLGDAGRFMDNMEAGSFEVETLAQTSTVNPAVIVPLLDLYTTKTIYYTYAGPETRLSAAQIKKLALRFTWHYQNPQYYSPPVEFQPEALAVVWGYDEPLPSGYQLVRKFAKSEKEYSFRPYVSIFLPLVPGRNH